MRAAIVLVQNILDCHNNVDASLEYQETQTSVEQTRISNKGMSFIGCIEVNKFCYRH